MRRLIQQCWNSFQAIKHYPFVVPNSIPILWFGDMKLFMKSDLRIVTVGLNPSNIEFLSSRNSNNYSVSYRFPKVINLVGKNKLSLNDILVYENTMNEYFTNQLNGKPTWYRTWFSNNESALHGLDASYYNSGDFRRTAIHIDLWTPVATDKWKHLTNNQRNILHNNVGYSFQQMLARIDPHVIITCVNSGFIKKYFSDTNGLPCVPSNAAFDYQKRDANGRSYAYIRAFRLLNGQVLIWGRNGNTPFARLNQKMDIIPQIQKIRTLLRIP